MKNFSKVMLSIIFTALIVGSVQPVYLEEDDVVDTQWTIFRKLN